MRFCHIVPSLEEQYGGPSKSVYQLAAALARLEHDVELLCTHPSAAETRLVGSLRLRVFRRDWPGAICPSSDLRAHLQAGEFDIIHHHALWLRTLHYAHQQAVQSSAKLVISPRGMMSTWAWRQHRWKKLAADRLIHPGALKAAAGWHATSSEEASEIHARGFQPPVCVAPNGVSTPSLEDIARSKDHWLAACPGLANQPVALFYSRFHHKKRVLELIDLWLERAPADWLLLMVGIPQEYEPSELEAYVMRASGAGRVKVLNGTGQPSPYGVASLLLLPSHSENFGLVIAEAMAHALPVLVTDGTPWSALNRSDLGWCVPWEQYGDALVAALAEGPVRLRERGQRAKDWVAAEFSWDKTAATLAAFYQQLAKDA